MQSEELLPADDMADRIRDKGVAVKRLEDNPVAQRAENKID